MARRAASFGEVFCAIKRLLMAEFQLDERACVIVEEPGPPLIPGSLPDAGFYLTIAPGSIQWDATGLIVGGAEHQCTVEVDVYISVCCRVHLDHTNSDEEFLLESTRGILPGLARVVKCLTHSDNADLVLNDDGDTCLREWMKPQGDSTPQIGYVSDGSGDEELVPMGWATVPFVAIFDLDLT